MSPKNEAYAIKVFKAGNRVNKTFGWAILISISLTFFHICCTHSGDYFAYTNSTTVSGFYLIPVLLLGGLYGYVIGLGVFLLAFILTIIFNMSYAYSMVIYMGVILTFALCSQYLWFKTLLKTYLTCTITFLVITFNNYLCYKAIATMNYNISSFFDTRFYTYKEIIAIYACGFFIYLFFKFSNDQVKITFPLGIGYTSFYQVDEEMQKRLKKTKLSKKITLAIVSVEIILGISVAIFMMVLFPDLKNVFIGRQSLEGVVSVSDRENFEKEWDDLNFEIDSPMISFDLKMIILMLCTGVPLAAFTNFYTKTFVAGPLGEMADFMECYSHTSDEDKVLYGHKIDDIDIRTNDEIQVMYEAVHSTVYEMEAYINRMKEKQKLEFDLEIAQKASEAKSSFLSNMSHEIRTPINAVIGMNEMILRESREELTLEYANSAKSAGNALLTLVNDILDFSKIEAGKMDIINSQYELSSTINDLVNLISAKAKEKNLKLEISVNPSTPVMLVGDEIRIKQCVTNLLTNAVKYTDEGSVVLEVSFEKVDDENIDLSFAVKDTGIGIREEELVKLYSPFERIDEIRNRTIEGTGLGMSIVKKLLALMDTKLIVKSVYGEGSEFSFTVRQNVVSWDKIGDFKEKYKDSVKSTEVYHARFVAPSAKILVVDDTDINLTVIKNLLKQTQVQVFTALSGFEAIKLVKENKYDIIFLDHRMPQMDGIETFEMMKTMEGNLNREVPVIALTANAVSGAKEEYVAHGFADYLAKPVNSMELEKMVEYYIPPEKIESVSIASGNLDYISGLCFEVPKDSILNNLKDIDLNQALMNCGGVETLEKVVKDFYISINPKANLIESFLIEEDIRNYTVLVHALKSSARLIGAMELSDMAAQLESYGNDGNMERLKEKTPELLAKYRGYKESFGALVKKRDKKLPMISKEDLEGAFRDIRELVDAYDFDTADTIMSQLEEYSIPEDFKETYEKLIQLMAEVDRDNILELL